MVGGSSGIGRALIALLKDTYKVVCLSRTPAANNPTDITHHYVDVLVDPLPQLQEVNALVYCPGSINLKSFRSLKAPQFQQDLDVNLLGAVRVFHATQRLLKKGDNPSVILFSTVAVSQGMPFHAHMILQ